MSVRCYCQGYRAGDRVTRSGVEHMRGTRHEKGDCSYALPFKDNDMREQVRSSFGRVSEGLMAIGHTVREYRPNEGPAIICDPLPRVVPAPQPRVKPVQYARSIVDRLIRIIEELIERDDLTPDADHRWYRNRLDEVKRELANAEEGGQEAVRPTGEGAAREASAGVRTGNGGLLQGD